MTDLLHILPTSSTTATSPHAALLPALEAACITTADLLTLDAAEIARRAGVPVLDARRLALAVLEDLRVEMGVRTGEGRGRDGGEDGGGGRGGERSGGQGRVGGKGEVEGPGLEDGGGNGRGEGRRTELLGRWTTVTTLDEGIDTALGGGLPTGYVTEVAGESGAGKTQFLLPLLLSTQLSPSLGGLARATIYISTEHALPTTRLTHILSTNLLLSSLPASQKPSLNRILTLQTPDLETQEHIISYQLPVAIARHDIGLVVIDSIAANFRAETGGASLGGGGLGSGEQMTSAQALAYRSTALVRLGALLRDLARKYDCAIVVSNQVADRFEAGPAASRAFALASSPPQSLMGSSPPAAGERRENSLLRSSSPVTGSQPGPAKAPRLDLEGLLSLDHQLRFFTGWGDEIPVHGAHDPAAVKTLDAPNEGKAAAPQTAQSFKQSQPPSHNYKTPSLGLVWANQIACRIALIKEPTSANRLERARPDAGVPPSMAEVLSAINDDGIGHGAEWAPRKWRRWVRVVFAPWVRSVSSGEEGVEFEIWTGGVRSLGQKG